MEDRFRQTSIDNNSLPTSQEERTRKSVLGILRNQLNGLEGQYTFLHDMKVENADEAALRNDALSTLKKAITDATTFLQVHIKDSSILGYKGVEEDLKKLATQVDEMILTGNAK